MADAPKFEELPDAVLAAIINSLTKHAGGSPADVCKLLLSSKKFKAAMHVAEPYWASQSCKQGWRQDQKDPSASFFHHYSRRMLMRRQVRSAFKQVIPFLDYVSQAALQPGATVQQLTACEERLGVSLPWQIWEMYRFRNGQDRQLNIDFAYGGRLLGLEELSLERSIGFDHAQEAPNAIDKCHQLVESTTCLQISQDSGPRNMAQYPMSCGDPSSQWLLPFTDMFSKRRQFAVDYYGRVHLIVGFTSSYKTTSCSAFLQSLLR